MLQTIYYDLRDIKGQQKEVRDKINAARTEFALEQLNNTDIPIATIAGLLGYGSTSAFDSFVKTQTGHSPTRIRAQRGPLPLSE